MTAWTTGQERFAVEHCNKGAEWIASAMRERFGVERTPQAVRCHCGRMGLSLRRYEICPSCGCPYTRLRPVSGLCPECAARELRDRTEARYFKAVENQRAAEAQARALEREAVKYRKRISRLKSRSK